MTDFLPFKLSQTPKIAHLVKRHAFVGLPRLVYNDQNSTADINNISVINTFPVAACYIKVSGRAPGLAEKEGGIRTDVVTENEHGGRADSHCRSHHMSLSFVVVTH